MIATTAETATATEIEATGDGRDRRTIDQRDGTMRVIHTRPVGTIELGSGKTDTGLDETTAANGTETEEGRDGVTTTGHRGGIAISSTTEGEEVAAAAAVGGIVVIEEADARTVTSSPLKHAAAGTALLPRNANRHRT